MYNRVHLSNVVAPILTDNITVTQVYLSDQIIRIGFSNCCVYFNIRKCTAQCNAPTQHRINQNNIFGILPNLIKSTLMIKKSGKF